MLSKMWSGHGACAVWYHSVLGFCFQKSQCSLFSCPSVIERLKLRPVSPAWWRIPVLETAEMEEELLLLLPFKKSISSERFWSLSCWLDEVEKNSYCQSWAQWSYCHSGVAIQFMDGELAEGGLVLGNWQERIKRNLALFCELSFRKTPTKPSSPYVLSPTPLNPVKIYAVDHCFVQFPVKTFKERDSKSLLFS